MNENSYIDIMEDGKFAWRVVRIVREHEIDFFGEIRWDASEKRYCFYPQPEIYMDDRALLELGRFMADQRSKRAKPEKSNNRKNKRVCYG